MLEGPTKAVGTTLPPMHFMEDRMKVEDAESLPRLSLASSSSSAQPHRPNGLSLQHHHQPNSPYSSYSSNVTHTTDPDRRGSNHRLDQSDGPLPSLRSVTGIGEALDTTRPADSYSKSFSGPPPPPPPPPSLQTPSYTSAPPTQSPTALRNHDSLARDRQPYERQQQQQQQQQQQPPPPTTSSSSSSSSYPPQTRPQATSSYPYGHGESSRPPHADQPAPPPPPPPHALSHPLPPQSAYHAAATAHGQEPQQWRQQEHGYPYGAPDHAAGAYPNRPRPLGLQNGGRSSPPSSHQLAAYEPRPDRLETAFRPDQPLALLARREDGLPGLDPAPRRPYGESVKQHLDHFDLETAFAEIGEYSKSLFDFSQHFRTKAQQTPRSGPLPGSTPNLKELEDMASQTARIQNSLAVLHEVILKQQAALAERHKEPFKPSGNPNGDEASSTSPANAKDGFAGDNNKRKRGRAAPPGRCHSCNRAETPEWRRGPDGARTLCNACGLHYAKLTRKMGGKQPGPTNSSNLKPRTMSDHSST